MMRVLAAVIRRGPRVLVCRRPEHKRHGGMWEFPGGKVEAGESDLEAIRRELEEELDVRVTHIGDTAFSVRDPGSEFVLEFVPVEIDGQPRCLEHDDLAWVSVPQLLDLPLAPGDRRYVESLCENARGQPDEQPEPRTD